MGDVELRSVIWMVRRLSFTFEFGLRVSTLLVAGRIADIYGRRALFVGGMAFYTLCSIISPFVPVGPSCILLPSISD